LMWLAPFPVPFQSFVGAAQYFEEILLDIKKEKKKKELIKYTECSDVLVQCE